MLALRCRDIAVSVRNSAHAHDEKEDGEQAPAEEAREDIASLTKPEADPSVRQIDNPTVRHGGSRPRATVGGFFVLPTMRP